MPNKRSQMKGGWSKPKPRKTSTSANRKALRLSGAPPKRAKKRHGWRRGTIDPSSPAAKKFKISK